MFSYLTLSKSSIDIDLHNFFNLFCHTNPSHESSLLVLSLLDSSSSSSSSSSEELWINDGSEVEELLSLSNNSLPKRFRSAKVGLVTSSSSILKQINLYK